MTNIPPTTYREAGVDAEREDIGLQRLTSDRTPAKCFLASQIRQPLLA